MAKSVYDETYARSMRDPEGLPGRRRRGLHWDKGWDRVLDDSRESLHRWFVGGELNTCYNALDLHVDRGRGKQGNFVYDSPVTGTVRSYTYRELPTRWPSVPACSGIRSSPSSPDRTRR